MKTHSLVQLIWKQCTHKSIWSFGMKKLLHLHGTYGFSTIFIVSNLLCIRYCYKMNSNYVSLGNCTMNFSFFLVFSYYKLCISIKLLFDSFDEKKNVHIRKLLSTILSTNIDHVFDFEKSDWNCSGMTTSAKCNRPIG